MDVLNKKLAQLHSDIAHFAPGEFINILEALPFLNNNTIVLIINNIYSYNAVIKIKFQLFYFYIKNLYLL